MRKGEAMMRCRGIRGATTAAENSRAAILTATRELLETLVARNDVAVEEITSAFFTVTDDLDADYPAQAARQMGWDSVALLCAREIAVPGSLGRCVRVLLHVNTERTQAELRHAYLGDAARLRPEYGDDRPAPTAESATVRREGGRR
jgi:chorismate mutase